MDSLSCSEPGPPTAGNPAPPSGKAPCDFGDRRPGPHVYPLLLAFTSSACGHLHGWAPGAFSGISPGWGRGSHGPYHLPQCVDETQGVCTHADESGLRLTCKAHVLSSSQTLECQSPRGSRSCAWTPECSLAPCRSWREAARWTFFTSIFHSHSPISGPQAT